MPLIGLFQHRNTKEEYPMEPLGSGLISPIMTSSIIRQNNDNNAPQRTCSSSALHKQTVRRSTNASAPTLVTHRQGSEHHYLYHHDPLSSPPVSPPPLSPTNLSFATITRPSLKLLSPTYQPASSLSSADSDSDDDEPLGHLLTPRLRQINQKACSLLSDVSEEGDDDLVPIARLSISRSSVYHLSAAEKYKAKVKAKLRMTDKH
ncbi:uncharacterized protein B0P05DRAFT_565165 [Gilbertella persicaria]|uniref:uncharacterized protein n=1 Tax=Gilbertella persicaria TaxID=101096 RepID=UPI00221F6752|nr:uncharacterized protein B0P05DRAFT_565165 [Gilbertella persicaria]KAI8047811.1 hypothetical protein B0P05DRAFT_565165 [Gilbertella persicaria]